MSRHGYTDDYDEPESYLWRGRVMSAIRGKRGQRLLIDLRDALDAMPEKRLVKEELVTDDGDVCALGCVGKKRQVVDLEKMDPAEHDVLGKAFDIAPCMVQEIEYENDDGGYNETPEERWERMRKWCDRNIIKVTP